MAYLYFTQSFLLKKTGVLKMTDSIASNSYVSTVSYSSTTNTIELNEKKGNSNTTLSIEQTSVQVTLSNSSEQINKKQNTITPEQVANTILNSVTQRIAELKNTGADKETIRDALKDARQGFKQGLKEAKETLKSLGVYDKQQKENLLNIAQRFRAGFKALKSLALNNPEEKVNNSEANKLPDAINSKSVEKIETNQNNKVPDTVKTIPEKNSRNSSTTNTNNLSENRSKKASISPDINTPASVNNNNNLLLNNTRFAFASFERNESIALQLNTQDGDKITLSFSAFIKGDFASSSITSTNNLFSDLFQLRSNSLFSEATQSTQQLSQFFGNTELLINIEGELDEDELTALQDLFSQLSELFNDFFNGSIKDALNQALSLDVDFEEIASLNLDLALSEATQLTSFSNTELNPANGNTAQANTQSVTLNQLFDLLRYNAAKTNNTFEQQFIEEVLSISLAAEATNDTLDKKALEAPPNIANTTAYANESNEAQDNQLEVSV